MEKEMERELGGCYKGGWVMKEEREKIQVTGAKAGGVLKEERQKEIGAFVKGRLLIFHQIQ